MFQTVYTCSKTATGARKNQLICAKEFAAQNDPPLILHTTVSDGNCLFDSLAQFGRAINHPPLLQDQESIQRGETVFIFLRRKLVEYAMNHIEDIYHSFNNTKETPENQILGMLKNKAWFSEMGDIAPQIIPHAFRINILFYNIYRTDNKNNNNKFLPDRVMRGYFEYDKNAPTIMLVRIYDGHYQWFSVKDGSSNMSISQAASASDSAASAASSAAASSHIQHEKKKLNIQNKLNSLSNSIAKLSLFSESNAKKPNTQSNKTASMYKKKSITRKKKPSEKTNTRTPQYNQFRFLINEMKKMNNNSTNKQNSIIYLSKAILNNSELSVNEKTELMSNL